MSQITDSDNPIRPPLGLPLGSVRALLTLLILAVVINEMMAGREVDILWNETLLIALAHYFSRRRFLNIPPEAVPRLQKEGILPPETRPLYLPTGVIRALILLAFGASGFFLYKQGRLFDPNVVPIFGAVGAYISGMIIAYFAKSFMKAGTNSLLSRWHDMQAMLVLITVASTAAIFFIHGPSGLPGWLRHAALFLSLYYFGAR
ncbi:hypothetical protein EBX93_13340 [bacterium]|nr:hypothetical protein [bacterium]